MTGDVLVRRARETDRDQIMALLETANFHRIPSPEMPEFDLDGCFVAELEDRLVGVAGYRVLEGNTGKTTLMAVLPEARGHGVGALLQRARMTELKRLGCRSVVTNADRPEVIAWYQRHFGYRKIGTLDKLHEFGDPTVHQWTTLECDLSQWGSAESSESE